MHALFFVAVLVTVVSSVASAYDCSKFNAGIGYGLSHKHQTCSVCVCDKDGNPVCEITNALWCPRSLEIENRCGKPNTDDAFFDGCNSCGCSEDGEPTWCSMRACVEKQSDKIPGETWTEGPNNCKKCVATVSGTPFCTSGNCPSDGASSGPDKDFPYCSVFADGMGFFDQNTCQVCFCKKDGTTLCRGGLHDDECSPNGQQLVNQCGQSNMGKKFWDGCNSCECGQTGTWPARCFSRAQCVRDMCGNRKAGDAWEEEGQSCICSHHGTVLCV